MAKPMMLIRAPVGTRSGYGDMARDICRHLINIDKWDVKIWPCPWGQTPMNALNPDSPRDKPLIDRMVNDQPPRQPEIFVSITVPNEFQPVGKFNIGITAGIETTACDASWTEGMNRMDVTFTISEHSKKVLLATQFDKKNQQGHSIGVLTNTKPVEVLHNCIDLGIFRKIPKTEVLPTVDAALLNIKERFCFLFVGHWLSGNIGADRKDVGMLVKVFLEVFRQVPAKSRPALILKTSGAGFSVLEREEMLGKIRSVRDTVKGKSLPSVYLLHGDMTDEEMNSLNNHPKVKAFVSFTKGEGFGRPLLEASITGKPIIVSGWSGHLDFLTPDEAILMPGKLEEVDPSAVWEGVINKGTQWFKVDYPMAGNYLHHIWKNYPQFVDRGAKMAVRNAERFSFEQIQKETDELFAKYLPPFYIPDQVELKLPSLPKLGKIVLKSPEMATPKLEKIPLRKAEKHGMEVPEGATSEAAVGAKASAPGATEPNGTIVKEGEEIDGKEKRSQ